jgi:hypothetical protein
MSWTYSLSSLATTPKDQVRLAIGDTGTVNPILGTSQQLMQDEEINYFLTLRSVFGAAAECCRALAAQFAALVDYRTGDTQVKYSEAAKAYLIRAMEFDRRSAMGCVPYVGGISAADKEFNEDDPDRVNPQFALGMFDSNLPLGQLAAEAPTCQTDENS